MIYVCEQTGCHFSFMGQADVQQCPDCGKFHLHEASPAERLAFFRYRTEALFAEETTG